MIDWAFGGSLIVLILAVDVYLAWRIGEYEYTGRRGWRRIPAGAMLACDVLHARVLKWLAKAQR